MALVPFISPIGSRGVEKIVKDERGRLTRGRERHVVEERRNRWVITRSGGCVEGQDGWRMHAAGR